jgi:hypothetical protein
MHNLHRFLVDYDMAMLRALAQRRKIALATNRQRDAADQMARALLEPFSLRLALASLSGPGRQALDAVLAAGGRMRAAQFSRQYGEIRPMGPGRLEREEPWRDPVSAAEELWYDGLLFRAFDQDPAGPGEFFFVPDDLLGLLPRPQAELLPFPVQVVDPPPESGIRQPALAHDLFIYLVHVQNHDIRLYADGRLSRRDRVALRERLPHLGSRRLALVQHLVERLDLVSRAGSSLRLEPGEVKRWLSAAPARRQAILYEAWRDNPAWDDLCRVPGLVCERKTAWLPQNDPVATRRALLALLARCAHKVWWTLPSFVVAVKESQPDFQRPDSDYGSWYIRDTASGEYLSGFENWDQVEGALIADLLSGVLYWLEVVDVAIAKPAEADGPTILCRLTDAGARLLGFVPEGNQAGAEPESLPLVVHADFRVEVPAAADFLTRFQLERFADLETEEPCRYRLTVSSLGRALARGLRGEQVLTFLRQAGDRPVPANVAGHLRLWAGRFGQVRLQEAALVITESERVMRELCLLPETRDLIGQRISATTALVHKKDLAHLQRALQVLGFLAPEKPPDDLTKRG